jgi:hypothetical protein
MLKVRVSFTDPAELAAFMESVNPKAFEAKWRKEAPQTVD